MRELATRGACRYTDLRAGLPGIATNLLAARLRELEEAGVIEREEAPPPVATALFRLTPRGRALRPVLDALGSWGVPLMREVGEEDAFRAPVARVPGPDVPVRQVARRAARDDRCPRGGESAVIEVGDGAVALRTGEPRDPDASLDGPPQVVMAVLSGQAEPRGRGGEGTALDGIASGARPRAAVR